MITTGSLSEARKAWMEADVNHTDNGTCIQCGDCCGSLLPLNDDEIKRIKKFVRDNNVKPCRHTTLMPGTTFDLTCPFLDEAKKDKKCRIYKVRPLICRLYKCDWNTDKVAEKAFWKTKHDIVDMWEVFVRND